MAKERGNLGQGSVSKCCYMNLICTSIRLSSYDEIENYNFHMKNALCILVKIIDQFDESEMSEVSKLLQIYYQRNLVHKKTMRVADMVAKTEQGK